MSFLLAIISFIISCCNFNLDFLCLVRSVANSGVGSRVGILSKFFIGKYLLLKLLRTFSLAVNNNHKLFRKTLFFNCFLPLSKFFILAAKLLCASSAFLTINVLHLYLLKNNRQRIFTFLLFDL